MSCLHRCLALLSCTVWLFGFVHQSLCHSEIPLMLLISFDGFRWDYLKIAKEQNYPTPNFDRLINNGVSIGNGGVKNTFITKTFPNHFTLVTGLYEENHGIVGNDFYDPEFNETFDIGNIDTEDKKWWDGKSASTFKGVEPIWITNERKEGGRVSGSYFWPGSIVDNQRPTYTRCYSSNSDFEIGVKTVVEWFLKPEKPINLGLLYFSEPDSTGHKYGAASVEVLEKIVVLDGILGHLLDLLEKHNLMEKMNIIVTSDHGMANTSKPPIILDTLNTSLFTIYGASPVWNVRPIPGEEENVYQALKKFPLLQVYKKHEVPDEFHYKNNRRIQSIIVAAPEGYNLCLNKSSHECELKGNHGYNNSLLSMHPFFIAHGPAFKKNYTASTFNNVDVYPLMCHVLELTPHPNDGNLDNVLQILANADGDEDGNISVTMMTFLGAVGITAFVSGICCIAACRSHRIYLRRNGQSIRRILPNSLGMAEAGRANVKPLLESEDEDFA